MCKALGSVPGPTLPKKNKGEKKFSGREKYLSAITGYFKYNTKIQNFVLSFFPKKCFGLKREININLETGVKSLVLSVMGH